MVLVELVEEGGSGKVGRIGGGAFLLRFSTVEKSKNSITGVSDSFLLVYMVYDSFTHQLYRVS